MVSDGTRRRGPGALLSSLVALAGFVLVLVGVYQGIRAIDLDLDRTSVGETPTEIRTRQGTYYVFQRFDQRDEESAAVRPDAVRVRTLTGDGVPTAVASSREEIWDGSSVSRPVVKFTTPRAGTYLISAIAPREDIFVQRAGFQGLADALSWFRLAGIGGLVIVAGVVLLLVGIVRRHHSTPVVLPPGGAPAFTMMPAGAPTGAPNVGGAPPTAAGWYPDPWHQATWRYHDGTAWTSHLG